MQVDFVVFFGIPWASSVPDCLRTAEQFGDRLYGVHIKDFTFDSARKPEDVVVGTGNLDLPKQLETMSAVNFDGAVVLEYEGDVEDPAPAITRCVEAVRALCD